MEVVQGSQMTLWNQVSPSIITWLLLVELRLLKLYGYHFYMVRHSTSLCVKNCVCAHSCVSVCDRACQGVPVDSRGQSLVLVLPSSFVWDRVSSLVLMSGCLVLMLLGESLVSISSLIMGALGFETSATSSGFIWVLEILAQTLMLVQQTLNPLKHPLSPRVTLLNVSDYNFVESGTKMEALW